MKLPIPWTGCRVTRVIALCLGPCLLGTAVPAAEEPAAAKPAAAAPAAGAQGDSAEKAAPAKPAEKADADKAEKTDQEKPEELKNWVEVGVGGVFLNGREASFQERHGLPGSAFGGIEGFHYEQGVGKDGVLKLDGRGLFDLHDYQLKLDLTMPNKGFVRAGYTESRTWSDASGGFLTIPAPSGTWISLFDESMALDRGEAWFEAGMTLPNIPAVTFRYSHQFRRGNKDSTIWGDHSLTGSNNGLDQRSIVPSFMGIDEARDIFELRATHTIQKTDLSLGLRYEISEQDDALYLRRRPGEPAADRYVTQRNGNDVDLFSVHGSSLTRFNEKLMLTAGAAFTTLDSDLSGQRFYGAGYDAGYDLTTAGRRQAGDQGFTGLSGGSELQEYVLNLNLMYTPLEYLTLVPSLRVQKQDLEGTSSYQDTMDTVGGTLPPVASLANTERELLSVSERLDLRYTAISNVVLYAQGDWTQDQGDLTESYSGRLAGAVLPNPNFSAHTADQDRFAQKYTAGANWYPLRRLNLGIQYYHKIRESDYDHSGIVRPPAFLPPQYPGFITQQEFVTDDVNFRVTVRPRNNLTFVSRYDFQYSTIDNQVRNLPEMESAEITSHLFGESVTWVPLPRLYLQAGVNVVFDTTETPAQDLTGAQANLVPHSQNDYWSGNLLAGYALDAKTDLQANYLYYRANNFLDNSTVSVPYGADAEEHGVTATLTRRITERMRWNLRYGYFHGHEDATGGATDYEAHLVYSSIQYRF